MGSPTIIADINSPSPTSQLAARLLDVEPERHDETLVARGLYRPEINSRHRDHAPGLPAPSERVEVRGRPHREARAAAGGPALRAQLQRPGAGHGLQPRAAPAGARAAGLARRAVQDPAPKVVPSGYSCSGDYSGRLPAARGRDAAPGLARARVRSSARRRTATHGPPLAFPSCSSPDQASPNLTVGTPDANGRGANSIGAVRLATIVGNPSTPEDEADVQVEVSITDVREAAGLGRLHRRAEQVTNAADHRPRQRQPATSPPRSRTRRSPRRSPAPQPPSTTRGSTCSISTTMDALVPGVGAGGQALDLGARAGAGLRRRPGRCGRDGRQFAVRGSGRVRALIV